MVKVSVVVPVCNVEKYLEPCLDSIANQSLKEIEIICVEDCSRDSSAEILRRYAQKDGRFIPVFHTENLGTSQTRKDGVLRSGGKYIMFVDGDDRLEPEACERAYQAMEMYGTDIVQFGTRVVNCAGVPEQRIRMNQRALEPALKRIEAENLISPCWKERKFNYTLWNKIYNGDLCRKAFADIEDGYYPKAQDLYAFFVIAYYAKTYMGIPDVLYNYNFGLGITGGNLLSLEKYDVLLTEKAVWDALNRFLKDREEKQGLEEILDGIHTHFLEECVAKWKDNLNPDARSEGFAHLTDQWGFENVLCALAARNWFNRAEIAEKIVGVDYFRYKKRPQKERITIAAYYRSLRNGGAQRVVASLCNLWGRMKSEEGAPLYRVILITDEPEDETDYRTDPGIKRYILPHFERATHGDYRERFRAWNRILDENDVDIVVSSMWVAASNLWDMMTVKGHPSKPAFVIHSHNFFCVPYRWRGNNGVELSYLYQVSDGVVCLSETDKRYTGIFSKHVAYIVNPVTFDPDRHADSVYEKNTLAWVGRISSEKNPRDVIYMMGYLVKEIPDAKLYLVGSGEEQIYQEMAALIHGLNLESNIVLVGFTENVEEYYQKASVCVSTSEFEGFPLTFGEAMSYGVPLVSYEMPWLSYMEDGRGIVTVKMGRYDLLAKEAAALLRDPEACKKTGREGKRQITELAAVDIGCEWRRFFAEINEENAENVENADPQAENELDDRILRYLIQYQHTGKLELRRSLEAEQKRMKADADRKEKEIRKLKKRVGALENSTTLKVGKAILFVPVCLKKVWKKVLGK